MVSNISFWCVSKLSSCSICSKKQSNCVVSAHVSVPNANGIRLNRNFPQTLCSTVDVDISIYLSNIKHRMPISHHLFCTVHSSLSNQLTPCKRGTKLVQVMQVYTTHRLTVLFFSLPLWCLYVYMWYIAPRFEVELYVCILRKHVNCKRPTGTFHMQ